MTSKRRKLLWVDDDDARKSNAGSLAYLLGFISEFHLYRHGPSENQVDEIVRKSKGCQLVIIDHFLDTQIDSTISEGSSLAELIRSRFGTFPIIGVSAAENRERIFAHVREMYDELYDLEEAHENRTKYSINAILNGYAVLKYKPKTLNGIIKLLQVPELDMERLIAILPKSLKENSEFKDSNLRFRISRWVRKSLLGRPGFLYDRLWLATYLGLKENALKKVENVFRKAVYNGIFRDEGEPRWWVSSVLGILNKEVNVERPTVPWDLGRRLKGINKRNHSVCYCCGGEEPGAPETVGYPDEESQKRVPLHLRCSTPHSKYEQSLYFEQIRVMTDHR